MYTPDLRTLCKFSQKVLDDSARDLVLLKEIDTTLDALRFLSAQLRGYAEFGDRVAEAIRSATPALLIDKDGELMANLDAAQASVHKLYEALIDCRESARRDRRLTADDGIEDAYTEAIAISADLHNATNALRWAIGEHDADLSPVSEKSYDASSLDELFRDLKS